MFLQYSLKIINTFSKFYFSDFIQPLYAFTTSQCKFHKEICTLVTRNCIKNKSIIVSKEYDKIYEEKLNTLLQDPHYKAQYDKYKLEVMYMKHSTTKVPNHIRPYSWLRLLQTNSKTERRAYIHFLWKISMLQQQKKQKQSEAIFPRQTDNNHYGLGKYSLFFRIRHTTISHFYNSKLISAILHEPILVIDLSYDNLMTPTEQENCAKQLHLLFATNRQHISPFNLYFCNILKDGRVMQRLHKQMPHLYDPDFPMTVTSKSYLELFDKKKLVYLTPNAENVMTNFESDVIYIIGGMVDKHDVKPHSFTKANKEGIRMLKLPLSERLNWGTGSSKNLPLNQVVSIMLDIKHSKSWDLAFQNIPKRKLQDAREYNMGKKFMKHKERKFPFFKKQQSVD